MARDAIEMLTQDHREAETMFQKVQAGTAKGARSKAPTHPHPHTPRSATGAKVAGMAASAMDKGRDSVSSRS